MSARTFTLKNVDTDDITLNHIKSATRNLKTLLDEMYENRIVPLSPALFDDSGTAEYEHSDFDSWIQYCRSSTHFQEVGNVYDELFTERFENADLEKASEIKNLSTPNLVITANGVINKLVLAYRDGEATIGQNPESEDPIHSGLYTSAQPEQEMLNAYEDRAKAAQADADAVQEAKEKGKGKADSITFAEQCFMLAYLPRIIKHKYKTLSKFKKLPYYADAVQSNDIPANASIMVHDDPFNFINKLLIYPDTKEYFNMKSEDIALLQPELRFFKTFYNE